MCWLVLTSLMLCVLYWIPCNITEQEAIVLKEEDQACGVEGKGRQPDRAVAILYDGGSAPKGPALPGPSNSIGAARAANSPLRPLHGRRNGKRHSLNRLMWHASLLVLSYPFVIQDYSCCISHGTRKPTDVVSEIDDGATHQFWEGRDSGGI